MIFKKINFTKCIISFLLLILSNNVNASSWTRSDSSYYYMPKFAQLTQNDIASFKVHITDKNPYATTGIFLQAGQYNPQDNTIIGKTTQGTAVKVQFDAQNFYPDGSVRFGLVTIEKPKNTDSKFEVILSNAPKQLNNATITPLKPALKVILNRSDLGQKTVTLSQAKSEKKPWRSGALIDIRRYFSPISKDFMVEFDITTFANGMVKSDVVMRYDRIYETPMHSTTYDAQIHVNNKLFKDLPKVKHNHHSKFRVPIRFGYNGDNITALNMSKITDTRALARYDMTFGVTKNAIHNDYDNLQNADNSINGSSLVNARMPDAGTREDIALWPQWTVRYLLTSHDKARAVVLKQGDAAAYAPWHFTDAKTNMPPLPQDHPKLWYDHRANMNENKIQPYNTDDTIWRLDNAHQPSLSYIPYLITGDRYYYDNLEATYSWGRFALINNDFNILRDPNLRTQTFHQVRGYAWIQRIIAEMALVAPQNSRLYTHLQKQMDADFVYFKKGHIDGLEYEDGKQGNPTGELFGMLHGWGSDDGRQNPIFMQNLAAIGMGFNALTGVNKTMRTISAFQTNFISGMYLQINNGYPPQYGPVYKMMQNIKDEKNGLTTRMGKIRLLSRWPDVFKYSINSGYYDENTKYVEKGELPGYYTSASIFTAYARAAQAMLYNVTKDPRALEAYGFLAQYLPAAFESYHAKPAFLIVPEIGKGYLTLKRTFNGDSGDDVMKAEYNYSLLHGQNGDDSLLLENFSGVAFGGNGNDILFAGKQDSFLFGGSGKDTLVSGDQNDYLKGDENYGTNPDIFVFTKQKFGEDTIADFTSGIDKIKFTPDTGILSFYHENKVYGLRRDQKDNPVEYRKIITPDLSKASSGETKEEKLNTLLADAARGDLEARKALKAQSQVNFGIKHYLRPDGQGGTYINFNHGRTPEEKKIMLNKHVQNYYGIIHLVGVPMDKLKASDFIFSE
ncbi:MAG: hypothetical protein ACJAQ0_000233 [Dasania sp.]|jgi:hypothetical protein